MKIRGKRLRRTLGLKATLHGYRLQFLECCLTSACSRHALRAAEAQAVRQRRSGSVAQYVAGGGNARLLHKLCFC